MSTITHPLFLKRNRRKLALLLALLTAVMPISIDMYLPAIMVMSESLNTSVHRIEQSLSIFVFGAALGQLIGGALSDIKGRRIIAISGLMVFSIATIMLIFVQNIQGLMVWRFIQALGGGIATVNSAALVRDRFSGRDAARMFAFIGIIMMIAPLIGPFLGAFIKTLINWRAIFVVMSIYSVWLLILLWKKMPETLTERKKLDSHIFSTIMHNYRNVFATREALGFLFFQALSFSAMFSFLTESSFVYMSLYGLNPHQYAIAFGANILTMMLFNRVTAYALGYTQPHNILLFGIAIQLICNIGLFISTHFFSLPPFALLLGLVMFSVGSQGLIVPNTQVSYMGYFYKEGGSANAVLGTIQALLMGLCGWLTAHFHDGSAKTFTSFMLLCSITGIVLLFLFSRKTWLKRDKPC